MICPQCGSNVSDNDRHCPSCGKLLDKGNFPEKSKTPPILVIGIIALFVVLIGIVAFFVAFIVFKDNSASDIDKTISTTVSESNSEVSTEEQKTDIPNVVGMKNIDAYNALSESHLLYQTTYEFSDSVPEDYVISQTPSSGNKAKLGNTVNICISKGAKPQLTEHDTQPIQEIKEIPEISNYSSDYILPYSDSRYLTKSDISWMDSSTAELALNEIYARHGRIFKTKRIADYFNSKSWYHGTVDGSTIQASDFNDYEKKNINLINAYMKEKGYR